MKHLLLGLFALLLLMSGVAEWLRPAPVHDGKVHLTWMTDQNPARIAQTGIFTSLHPGIQVKTDPPDAGSSIQKIVVQAASGIGPDAFDCNGPTAVQVCAEAGVLWDVTKAAQTSGLSVASGDLWPAVAGSVTYQGAQYTYPANVGTDILIYNKNVFDQYGVPYPAPDLSWDEFFALAAHFPRSEAGSFYAFTRLGWPTYFTSLDGEYFSADGTRLLLREGPLRQAWQMHHDALFKYRVTPRSLDMKTMLAQGGWAGDFSYFANNQFAMLTCGQWAIIPLRDARQDQENKLRRWQADPQRDAKNKPTLLRIGAVLLPHAAGHRPNYLVVTRSVGINVYSPRRNDALQFLNYLAGPDYSRTVNARSDNLPGNPKYADVGVEAGNPDLAALEMHRRSVEAMAYGRTQRASPFLLTSDVERVLTDQVNRMEVSPDLPIDALVDTAQRELESLLQRNLERDPNLKREYERRRQAERPEQSAPSHA